MSNDEKLLIAWGTGTVITLIICLALVATLNDYNRRSIIEHAFEKGQDGAVAACAYEISSRHAEFCARVGGK